MYMPLILYNTQCLPLKKWNAVLYLRSLRVAPTHEDNNNKDVCYQSWREKGTLVDSWMRPKTFEQRYLDSLAAAATPAHPGTPVVGKVDRNRHIYTPADEEMYVKNMNTTRPYKE